jgi:arylsulfatase A-like enzyme
MTSAEGNFRRSVPATLDSLRKFPSADVIVDHALAWLRENSDRPFFLWLHFMDPHAPYFPKPEALQLMGDGTVTPSEAQYLNSFWTRGDVSEKRLAKKCQAITKLYDAGIRWADTQVRRLTESLVDLNLWDKCALAVTADHGEEFLDHGGRFHAPEKLMEELIRVPLLIRVPEGRGAEVVNPVSLIDLAPTMLDILDLPSPADFRGRSRWMSTEQASQENIVISEAVCGCTNSFRSEKRVGPRILAVRKGNSKIVIDFANGREKFFDLRSDPLEQYPIFSPVGNHAYRDLLQAARKHLAESHKSRDFDRRNAALLRELQLEWAHPVANAAH